MAPKKDVSEAKKYKIRIPSTENETGDVYLAVNGKGYLIQRDQDVEITETLKELLDNSVINTVRRRDGKMVPVRIQRFPYERLD